MDGVDPITHKRMAAVRRSGTGPELSVQKILEGLGAEYRRNASDLPGTPDFYLVAEATPIFVHGCFWHRHPGCRKSSKPKTNQTYWETKFLANIERDKRALHELRCMGFRPMVIWQCETVNGTKLTKRIKKRLIRSV